MRFINITISVFLFCLLLITTVILMHFKTIKAADSPIYEMAGWLWTENYGWISLNSENPELIDYNPSVNYKVVVQGNEISGWGWSSNLGWVCFGKTCDPNNICNLDVSGECKLIDALNGKFGSITPEEPEGKGWQAKVNLESGEVSGWAKVIALKDSGIIKFNSDTTVTSPLSGEQCFNCKKKCIQWEQKPDPNNPDKTINGDCIKYSETEFDNCSFCFTKTYFGIKDNDGQTYPTGTPENEAVIGGSGNICFDCEICQTQTSLIGGVSRIRCNDCSKSQCKNFGSAHDFSSGALVGWSWNSSTNSIYPSVGWIQMNTGWAGIVYPWLETRFGPIYSSGGIRQRSVISGKNATYCIFAKDVYNFTSSQCQKAFYGDVKIDYLSSLNNHQKIYKNALGKIDINGLSTIVSNNDDKHYNKYGNEVIINNNSSTWNNSVLLGNKVYVINNDLTIDNGFEIKNDSGNGGGSGTVIINGNLLIKGNFNYANKDDIKTIKDIGSIAWIVKGDVIVNPEVKKIVGAFIVLGNGTSTLVKTSTTDENYPKFATNKYGVFSSGLSNNPLTVFGLIVAKAFNWERTYSNIKQGSERVIYDGRLVANPPPGLKGFAEGLPIIRDFEF